jgi:methylmalonyl-CoA mutase
MDSAVFFSEFPPIGKAEWLAALEKSLKGKMPLADLVWAAEADLHITPLVHADDFPEAPSPLTDAPNNWELSETIQIGANAPEAQAMVQEALHFGVEGLELRFDPSLSSERLTQVLEGVYLDFVGLHLYDVSPTPMPPAAALAALGGLAQFKGVSPTDLHGTVHFNPAALQGIVDWRYTAEFTNMAAAQFPGFRVLHADGRHLQATDTIEELATLLQYGNLYLTKMHERGLSPAQTANQLHFSIAIGDHYFLEMAKLRAFRQLWLHVLQSWNAPLQYPYISVSFKPAAYQDDLYTNLIRATTMGMSAVLGGANRLTVLPYDYGREAQASYPPAFGRRMARNVQHLLKMESHLDEAIDAMAGSYYLETLTRQLGEKAWQRHAEFGIRNAEL